MFALARNCVTKMRSVDFFKYLHLMLFLKIVGIPRTMLDHQKDHLITQEQNNGKQDSVNV